MTVSRSLRALLTAALALTLLGIAGPGAASARPASASGAVRPAEAQPSSAVRRGVAISAPKRVAKGGVVHVVAQLPASGAGRRVVLERARGQRWRSVTSTITDHDGTATFDQPARRLGTVAYRVFVPAARGRSGVTSRVRHVRVVSSKVAVSPFYRRITAAAFAGGTYDERTGRLVLRRTSASAHLQRGAVLTLPPSDAHPSGALVRVRTVARTRHRVRLATTPARLPDVIRNTPPGGVSVAFVPTGPARILSLGPGVSVAPGSRSVAGAAPAAKDFNLATKSFSVDSHLTIRQDPSDPSSPDVADLRLTGGVEVSPLVEMDLDVGWFSGVKSYTFGAGVGINAKVKTDITAKANLGERSTRGTVEIPIGQEVQGFFGLVGDVPVYVTITTTIKASIDAEGHVTFTTSSSGKEVVGVKGDEDDHFAPHWYHTDPETDVDLDEVSASVKAEVLASIEADLYGGVGPYVEGGWEAVGEFSREAATASAPASVSCSLHHEPVLSFGIRSSQWLKKLGVTIDLPSYEVPFDPHYIARCPAVDPVTAPGGGDPTDPTDPTSDPPVIGTSYLADAYQYDPYTTTLFTTGDDAGTWAVTGGSLPAGLTLASNGVLSGAPTVDGTFPFEVTFTADDGRKAKQQESLLVNPVEHWSAIDPATSCGARAGGGVTCFQRRLTASFGDGFARFLPKDYDVAGTWSSFSGSCGLHPDGSAGCLSFGYVERLADDPPRVRDFPLEPGTTWKRVSARKRVGCGVRQDGTARCWSATDYDTGNGYTDVTDVPGTWKSLQTMDDGWCGIRTDDTAACWAWVSHPNPGDPDDPYDDSEDSTLDEVEIPGAWRSLETSDLSVCGVRTDGSGMCVDPTQPSDGPVEVPGEWTRLVGTLTPMRACGQHPDRSISCFQGDQEARHFVPWDAQVPAGPWAVLEGQHVFCGIRPDATAWCWGDNASGAVGNGSSTADAGDDGYYVGAHELPGHWAEVRTSDEQTCGIQTDRTGWCWGASDYYTIFNLSPTRVRSGP